MRQIVRNPITRPARRHPELVEGPLPSVLLVQHFQVTAHRLAPAGPPPPRAIRADRAGELGE